MSELFAEVVDEDSIQRRVKELADEIAADYSEKDPVLLGVLKGSVPFLADLCRHLDFTLSVEFLALTRFGEQGRVSLAMDALAPLHKRHVILVEDIIDTGLTLATVRRLLETRGVASLAAVTLLDKAPRRIVDVPIEYRGFEVGDEFLLGYGLDYEGRYRNLCSLWAIFDIPAFKQDPDSLARVAFPKAVDRLIG